MLRDGPQEHLAALAFGTPPGIVLSPKELNLFGRATAGLRISGAYAVAALDPVLGPLQHAPEASGVVESVAIAAEAEAPMQVVVGARALPDRGLEGDGYARGAGTFSSRAASRPGFDLTLIAAEVVDELTAHDPRLGFASTRRNILTRGIDVNALVGREFSIAVAALPRGLG